AEGRYALRVAQQRRDVDGLAGAIDAALGIDEGVEAGRHRAAGDAAIGEVEGRRLQAEERVVAARVGRDQERRRERTLPAREAHFELNGAGIMGALGRKNLVAARQKPPFRGGAWLRRLERIHEGTDAVVAGERGQAEVGDDKPLGGELVLFVPATA